VAADGSQSAPGIDGIVIGDRNERLQVEALLDVADLGLDDGSRFEGWTPEEGLEIERPAPLAEVTCHGSFKERRHPGNPARHARDELQRLA
jgi:hypothetical protein